MDNRPAVQHPKRLNLYIKYGTIHACYIYLYAKEKSMLGLSTEKTDKPNAVLANILNIKTDSKDDKFSLMLKSFSFGKSGSKELLETDAKETTPNILLSADEKSTEDKSSTKTSLMKLLALGKEDAHDEENIHPDILKALPSKTFKQDLQQLIGEAKAYLKDQIAQKIDIKELPKTLGGLIKLAEKSGIDVRAISFESLPKTAFTQELAQAIKGSSLTQNTLPHSTSELVKPALVNKQEKENSSKPLNALLSKINESLVAGAASSSEEIPAINKAKPFSASLSALLHGETVEEPTEGDISSKPEGEKASDKSQLVGNAKLDQFSQKLTEAKQLVQHVAQSMKESVENYKPPFTRVKMQLNPHKFGEMEVTLVQRGNNVHININANTTALTVMMQNSHELKAQLSAQGLGDASMNFSSHQQQHNEQQKREQAHSSYEAFQDFDEEFTEVATALEVIVPRYI
jgi:hypothetical protein